MKPGTKKVIFAAMAANVLIAATKFFAAWWTGSSAILSEGVHSLVDTGNQVLLLYGLHRAERPPDEQFPFGHGKEIYFWSFVVAILIFALGAGISFYEGIQHLLYPNPIENPGMNYIIITAALVFEGVSWLISIGEFKRSKRSRIGFLQAIRKGKDPSLFLIVMEDSAAMLGLLAALAGIYLTQVTGSPLFDGAASVLISFILGVTAILLARETKGLLIGEAADVETVRTIKKILINGEHVDHLNEVLTLHMGPDFVVATVSLHFVDHMSAVDVERTVVELEDAIKKRVPEVKKVFIEAEAWNRSKRNTV